MDEASLHELAADLLSAIAYAKAHGESFGLDQRFTEEVRHARIVHDNLVDAIYVANNASNSEWRGIITSTEKWIEALEARAAEGSRDRRSR